MDFSQNLDEKRYCEVKANADANMYSRRGYGSSDLNTDDFVLNASLSQPFFKGKLIARIEAFDLLHQLSNTQYAVYFCTFTKVPRAAPSPGIVPFLTTPCCTWCTTGTRTRKRNERILRICFASSGNSHIFAIEF